ncbi:MAG: acylneuraminate cytidylyltransferase family protein [Gallionellaceae bacterium]|nr:acylneuraminate cytidylyltransferase family protein [Gallionellaceae bacterium]
MNEAHVHAEHDSHLRPRVIAVIPARGGSTRLPDKNMRLFCGRPLVAWTILAAVNALTVDEVWVTSDSQRILDLAEALGAKPYLRPEVEDDDAPGYVPMLHLIGKVMRPEDVLVGLMATSPLRRPGDVDLAVKKYFASPGRETKILQTFVPIHEDYRWRFLNDDCAMVLPPDENNNCRFDGSIHISTRKHYEDQIAAKGETYWIPYLLETWQGFDVNTVDQLGFAELVFYKYILGEGLNPYEVYRKGGLKV